MAQQLQCNKNKKTIDVRSIKRFGRFNYFHYGIDPLEDCDPEEVAETSELVHEQFEKKYKERFDSGDDDAIFQYVAKDNLAFRSRWVAEIIEKWKKTGEWKKCRKLMNTYTCFNGKRTTEKMLDIISKDQEIFKFLVEKYILPKEKKGNYDSLESVILDASEKFSTSDSNIDKVYVNYKLLAESHRASFSDLYKNEQFSWVSFFEYLSKCLKNIKNYRVL